MDELAARLDVNLHSHGVCYPCLWEYGRTGDNWFVVTLWSEGLGDSVAAALRAIPDHEEAKRDFEARGCRSAIFRAVVRRLARDLEENTQKALAARWN
jgi:hypothetical protein